MTEKKPNIIIIVADDLGYGDVSMNGSEQLHTPNIDRIAATGVKFTDFHSNGTVCSPTRAALLTGRYQQRSNIIGVLTASGHRHEGLDPDKFTALPKLLKPVGYKTALFGKWHVGYDDKFNPIRHGFDEFKGFVSGNIDYISHIDEQGHDDWWQDDALQNEEGYTTDLISQHGLNFIEENKDQPFMLYLAHECPHYPYQASHDVADRVSGEIPSKELKFGSRRDKAVAYKEMMESMDRGIGQVVDAVNKHGLENNTLIFFFSDNGPVPPGSNGELRGWKGNLYEGGHRVPAAACWPGYIPADMVVDTPCLGMDIYPTVAALAGVELPGNEVIDGVDLSELLFGSSELQARPLFWGQKELSREATVRNDYWKLIDHDGTLELYDLENDLGETNDLSEKHPEMCETMLGQLNSWRDDVHGRA